MMPSHDSADDLSRDPLLTDAVRQLRAPVPARPEALAAIATAIRAEPVPAQPVAPMARPNPAARAWRWLRAPRPLVLSPLQAAAALLVVAAGTAALTRATAPTPAVPATSAAALAAATAPGEAITAVRFTLQAPEAHDVALVGDFNAWDPRATRLERRGDAWTVVVPVSPGRHQYGFVVDGTRWIADPLAPAAPADDFGSPNSVLYVGS